MRLRRRRAWRPKIIGLRSVLFVLGMLALLLMTDTLSILKIVEDGFESFDAIGQLAKDSELLLKSQDQEND